MLEENCVFLNSDGDGDVCDTGLNQLCGTARPCETTCACDLDVSDFLCDSGIIAWIGLMTELGVLVGFDKGAAGEVLWPEPEGWLCF